MKLDELREKVFLNEPWLKHLHDNYRELYEQCVMSFNRYWDTAVEQTAKDCHDIANRQMCDYYDKNQDYEGMAAEKIAEEIHAKFILKKAC
jgi:hypothetical protein